MPTPVSVARQCLTEDAARALDDAVAVARRRSHSQTTSLHAVSALLALPSSSLRDACARARSSAYFSRRQFRALELCVGVSLDRLPSCKTQDEPPPISNSLMAAIKRSQANQRRHPETFHLQQIHSNNQPPSLLKVELKHFIISILDDPIVSRVFGEAGFRSCDIKFALVHPPLTPSSRFPRSRCPPIFLCNLTDSSPSPSSSLSPSAFSFPFSGYEDNCKRIGEILARKTARNPLLVGVCAAGALNSFTECVQRDIKTGALPTEISKLTVICIEKEIIEFVVDKGSEDKMGLKFQDLRGRIEHCSGPGIAINFGELSWLIRDSVSTDALRYVVAKLTGLLRVYGGKVWLMGAVASDEIYTKLLGMFPSIDKDWDLHLLTISSSSLKPPLTDGAYSKSSLMGSFVPFGGFFPTPSEFKNPSSSSNQFITRCHYCNEKYQQEVAAVLKSGSTVFVADRYSETFPSWLQVTDLDTGKGVDVAKAKEDGTTLNARILGLRRKWDDVCQRLHRAQSLPKFDVFQTVPQVQTAEGFQFVSDREERSNKDTSLREGRYANLSPHMQLDLQRNFPPKHNVPKSPAFDAENANFQSRLVVEVSMSQQKEKESPWFTPYPLTNLSQPPDWTSSSPVTSVTTDLGLGTLYASTSQEPNTPKLQDHKMRIQHISGSLSAELDAVSENTSREVAQPPTSGPCLGAQFDPRDYKSLRRDLAEKVGWQDGAICNISQIICRCRAGNGRQGGLYPRRDIWLTFLGPDKIGKKRIASALAEIMFDGRESLISVDMSSQYRVSCSNSMFECQAFNGHDVNFGSKTDVDYIAGELGKKPHSVIFLENLDQADSLVQSSLSQAIKTGKFPDSHGRQISIGNMIFITTVTTMKSNKSFPLENEVVEFPEERILGAKNWQMQIVVSGNCYDSSRGSGMNVRVTPKGMSDATSDNKRKWIDIIDSSEQEIAEIQRMPPKSSRSILDLNLPVDETEEDGHYGDCESDSMSENTEAWLEDFFDKVDGKVVFEPFNFDALAKKITNEIGIQCQKTFGFKVLLDIDHEVMVQILAAAWLSDRKEGLGDWVEKVLGKSLFEFQQMHNVNAHSVVKLVACEGLPVLEQAPGLCLPSRINMS